MLVHINCRLKFRRQLIETNNCFALLLHKLMQQLMCTNKCFVLLVHTNGGLGKNKATNLHAQHTTKMTILLPVSFKSSACHPLQSLRAQSGWCVSVSGFKQTFGSFCGASGCGVTRKLTARRAPDLASSSALSKASAAGS